MIAPDQKAWMDRMIKDSKIAIPPGGTLEKGSLYSMFVRMLLHNAMEEQKAAGSVGCGGRGRRRIEQVAENGPQHRSRIAANAGEPF